MARRRRGTAHEAALQALLEEARNSSESQSAARRHHLVPAFYLNRWAEEGKIRVTDLNQNRSWLTTPRKAASETDFYRIEAPDIDPHQMPPLLFEVAMSKVEQWGAEFISAAIQDPAAVISDDQQRVFFSIYMAFQYVRGRNFRSFAEASATELVKLRYENITDEGIRQAILEQGEDATPERISEFRSFVDQLMAGELTIGPDRPSLIGLSGQSVEQIGFHLFARGWRVYHVQNTLLTSDEPIVPIAGPPYPRGERAGVGNAGVVIFALAPQLLLAMFDGETAAPPPGDELSRADVIDVNREIASAATTYAFERPKRKVALALNIPAPAAPISREGPLPFVGEEGGALFRTHRPTRWAGQELVPPWPVTRWWRWA